MNMNEITKNVRPGDAKTIQEILENFTFMGDPMSGVYANCLHRYQAIAQYIERNTQ